MVAATMADTTMASDLLMPTPKLMPDISTDTVLGTEDTDMEDTVMVVVLVTMDVGTMVDTMAVRSQLF